MPFFVVDNNSCWCLYMKCKQKGTNSKRQTQFYFFFNTDFLPIIPKYLIPFQAIHAIGFI